MLNLSSMPEGVWESGGTHPCILNFGARWKQEVFIFSLVCRVAVGPTLFPVEYVAAVG